MAQVKDLTVDLVEKVGSLAEATEALGRAGVNIEGICGFVVNGMGILHIAVDDAENARQALRPTGARVTAEEDALVVEIEDVPGAIGKLTRRIAHASVSLSAIYMATRTRVVIGARDLEKARAVSSGLDRQPATTP